MYDHLSIIVYTSLETLGLGRQDRQALGALHPQFCWARTDTVNIYVIRLTLKNSIKQTLR